MWTQRLKLNKYNILTILVYVLLQIRKINKSIIILIVWSRRLIMHKFLNVSLHGLRILRTRLILLLFRPPVPLFEFLGGLDLSQNSTIGVILLVIIRIIFPSCLFVQFQLNFFNFFFNFQILFLGLVLILCFSVNSLLIFYTMFELRLIPILLIIIGGGCQPERWLATKFFLLYTMTASLPLLVILLYLNSGPGRFEFFNTLIFTGQKKTIKFIFFFLLSAFLVKSPFYGLHLWLPKAHVEAPTRGSIILATLILKLGAYGLLILVPSCRRAGLAHNWGVVALITRALVRLLCVVQIDIKVLIAYSSVAHMGLCLGLILSLSERGLAAAVIIIFAHGASSGLIFSCAGVSYSLNKSRNILLSTGLMPKQPFFCAILFIACMGLMAVPPTLNLLGEIQGFCTIVRIFSLSTLPLRLAALLRIVYSLLIYSSLAHGKLIIMRNNSIELSESIYWGLIPLATITLLGWTYWN